MTAPQSVVLDVIIVTWNTKEMTCECVDSVLRHLEVEGVQAAVWVVDNNSADGTVEALRERYPNLHVIANDHNAGFAVANNIAIQRSSAPFVLLLNSDAFLHPGCLRALLAAMLSDIELGAIGPKLLLRSGRVQHSVTRITSPLNQLGYLFAFHCPPLDQWLRPMFLRNREMLISGNAPREVPLLSAACLLLRRDVFDRVGLLPEDRFLYSEEDDLFFRMRTQRIKSVFLPSAQATHLSGASTQAPVQQAKVEDHFTRSRLRFLFAHYPRSRIATFAMHWAFFTWCKKFAQLKYLIRRGSVDAQYVAVSGLLLDITKAEYLRLQRPTGSSCDSRRK